MDYLSAQEKARLETELRERTSNRLVLSRRIQTARELGDLSENAEYHAALETRERLTERANAAKAEIEDIAREADPLENPRKFAAKLKERLLDHKDRP